MPHAALALAAVLLVLQLRQSMPVANQIPPTRLQPRRAVSLSNRGVPPLRSPLSNSTAATTGAGTPLPPSPPVKVRNEQSSSGGRLLAGLVLLYAALFMVVAVSHRAQTYVIYLHWLRPPQLLYPLNRLEPYRLASSARVVSQGHLRGWHLLPPGPPFVDGSTGDFDARLGLPRQRVFIFFHGNSGTRACPSKRVDTLRLLAAHFRSHVVTFDYSGFGDSGGRPSEMQLHRDARSVYEWVRVRVAHDAEVVVYGQSLGTFAAVDLAAAVSGGQQDDCSVRKNGSGSGSGSSSGSSGGREAGVVKAVILEAPPASLLEAAMSHPVGRPFRVVPFCESFFRMVLRERLDSVGKVGRIRVPILILHGEVDGMIGVEQGQRIFDAARRGGLEEVEFVRFPGYGHNNVNSAASYLLVVHAFLDKHVAR